MYTVRALIVLAAVAGGVGNGFANDLGRRNISAALERLFRLAVIGTGGGKCLAGAIVNDLRVDMADGAIYAQARTLRSARNGETHTLMNAFPLCRSR